MVLELLRTRDMYRKLCTRNKLSSETTRKEKEELTDLNHPDPPKPNGSKPLPN